MALAFFICLVQHSPEIKGREERLFPATDRTAVRHDYGARGSTIQVSLSRHTRKTDAQESSQRRLGCSVARWMGLPCLQRGALRSAPRGLFIIGEHCSESSWGSFLPAPPRSLWSCQHPPPWRWETPPENLVFLCLSGHIHRTQRPLRSPLCSSESTLSLTGSHAYT